MTIFAESLRKLEAGHDLSRGEAQAAMEELLEGRVAHAEVVAMLLAMRAKGEAVEEVIGFALSMRRHAQSIHIPRGGNHDHAPSAATTPLVDTCGTGGDRSGTFNVSTAAALVAAGAGLRVAKHGNRSISSPSGSADVLEALGLKLDAPPERAGESLARFGIAFLYAPAMHTAMRHAMSARREVGGRTVFNLLGPLTNPAGASVQVIGVSEHALVDKLGHALAELGGERAFIVHGVDGIDEISLSDETEVADVTPHHVKRYRIAPEDFGVARAMRDFLLGGDAAHNARIIRQILEGQPGPRRDFVCINAAAALVAAGAAADFREGARQAAHAIDSGAALSKLDALIKFSHSG